MYLALQHLKQFGKQQWANIRRIVQFLFFFLNQTELFREGAFGVKNFLKKTHARICC